MAVLLVPDAEKQIAAPDLSGSTLVKTLVGMHGGTIGVTSGGIDQGISFTVILPTVPSLAPELQTLLAPPAETAEAAEAAGAAEAGPVCHRILVVDDNVDAAQTMVMLLGLSGHDARAAFGGQEALDMALAFRPDVLFLDIGMPGMSGYEVARHMLAAPATASTKLIALTGWGTKQDIQKSTMAGFHAHLTKPVDPDAVDALLAKLLPAKQAV